MNRNMNYIWKKEKCRSSSLRTADRKPLYCKLFANKNAVEIQFFWVFVMIAGALILLFFFSLSQRYKSLSETKLAFSISSVLDAIITEVMQSPDTFKEIPMPRSGIGFYCSAECACSIKIGRTGSLLSSDKILFGHGLLKEKDIVLWSKPFKLPFRIANFLFVTNKRVLYVFVSPAQQSPLFDDLKKSVGDKIEAVFVSDANEVVETGYLSYRFVFVGSAPGGVDSSFENHDDVSAVYFSDVKSFDSVRFYKKVDGVSAFEQDVSAPDVFFLPSENLPLVLAAVFSDDHQMFSCNVKNAFKRMSYVVDVYTKRIDKIKPALIGDLGKCAVVSNAVADLNQMKADAGNLFDFFDSPEALNYINSLKRTIYDAGGLERKNRVYLEQGCRFGVY